MNRIRSLASTLGLIVLAAAGATRASAQKGGVGVINIERVLGSVPKYVTADSLFNLELDTYSRTREQKVAELQGDMAKLQTGSPMLSPVAKAAAEKKIRDRGDSLNLLDMAEQKRLRERRNLSLGPIEAEVDEVIKGVRMTMGLSVIFNYAVNPNPIVSIDDGADITEKVLQALRDRGMAGAAPAIKPAGGAGGGGGEPESTPDPRHSLSDCSSGRRPNRRPLVRSGRGGFTAGPFTRNGRPGRPVALQRSPLGVAPR